ncbi:MAG: SDR family oxidoreductase [Azoarcus sp.]|nr:SDR family oxidoreductase [Azoarcus sp.]
MKRILVVGCGDIARRAIPWLAQRHRVFALVHRPQAANALRALGAVPISGDLDDRQSLARLAGLADAVLHFAPPPTDDGIRHDPRTAHLLAALAERGSLPQRIVYISTTGVYGDCAGAEITETRACRAFSARAIRRLDAETRLRAFGRRNGVAVAILRAPGIYAADRLPVERLRRGDPVAVAAEDVFTSHIHADDLARLTLRALACARPGRIYNATDDSRLKMGDYFDLVADALALPRPPRLPREHLRARLSPGALSFVAASRRIDNTRITGELAYRLRYPTVAHGLATIHDLPVSSSSPTPGSPE